MPDRIEYRVLTTTNADAPLHVFPDGVFAINLDTDRVHIFDGVTAGGKPLALLSDVTEASGASLALEPLIDPMATLQMVDSYLQNAAFQTTVSGVGAAITIANATAARGGLTNATTGTTSTGRAARGPTLASGSCFVFSSTSGRHCFKAIAAALPILSTGVDQFSLRLGFLDSASAAPVDGVYVEIDSQVSPFMKLITISNSVATTTVTAITWAAVTSYEFKIVVTADTSVKFYYRIASGVNPWILLATHTTNIPSGTARALSAGYLLLKSLGTNARLFELQTIAAYQVPA